MASITGTSGEKVFSLSKFYGLNQAADGDTKLKFGEAAQMRNFRVTRDGNLQKRSGTKTLVSLSDNEPVMGLWTGYVMGEELILAACGGKLYRLTEDVQSTDTMFSSQEIGSIDTENEVHFFGFSNIVYMLNGSQYMQYDGEELKEVAGYVPLVAIAITPDGGGETLEQVNKLTGRRRAWISPDGVGTTFKLPESGLLSLDYVKDLKTGVELDSSTYSYDLTQGTVTFTSVPQQAANAYEIGWAVDINFRSEVASMRYSELYSGTQDTRVFIYGNGTNECLYSDLDYDGKPRADYFPDMNEARIGDENTPVTGLIRHYSTLICYKENSTWAISYGLTGTVLGEQIPAFYITPINRTIGNAALGQVRLVLNAPYALFGNDLYEYRNNASYASNLSVDERQAKRISDRIYASLDSFTAKDCYCFDDNDAQEYYICHGDRALVLNYAADAWSEYTDFPVKTMMCYHGGLYIGSPDGKVKRYAYRYLNDDGRAIDACWESGSMSFGQDYMRKYSAQMWVGIKPENNSAVYVTVQTDKKSSYTEKLVSSSLANFVHANFARWSFKVNRKPEMKRLKIKAKKFVFYKLLFRIDEADVASTVLAADIRVRFTGYAK